MTIAISVVCEIAIFDIGSRYRRTLAVVLLTPIAGGIEVMEIGPFGPLPHVRPVCYSTSCRKALECTRFAELPYLPDDCADYVDCETTPSRRGAVRVADRPSGMAISCSRMQERITVEDWVVVVDLSACISTLPKRLPICDLRILTVVLRIMSHCRRSSRRIKSSAQLISRIHKRHW
jgi:hypothetical protein